MFDFTFWVVFCGVAMIGFLCGTVGVFAVLRKQALAGDVVAHASLPGIVLAFLFTGSKNMAILTLGAGVTGILALLFLHLVTTLTKIKQDAGLGMILAVFFASGIALLTLVQNGENAGQSGLDSFLFGQASTLLLQDVYFILIVVFLVLLFLFFLWRQLKLLIFDRGFAIFSGYKVFSLEIVFYFLLVLAIVVSLQAVGVVLVSALVVTPVVAARQWISELRQMVFLSGFFGALSGASGAFLSMYFNDLPTGPSVILCATLIFLFSLFFAPARGLIWLLIKKMITRCK